MSGTKWDQRNPYGTWFRKKRLSLIYFSSKIGSVPFIYHGQIGCEHFLLRKCISTSIETGFGWFSNINWLVLSPRPFSFFSSSPPARGFPEVPKAIGPSRGIAPFGFRALFVRAYLLGPLFIADYGWLEKVVFIFRFPCTFVLPTEI